ncbi:YtzI protein [Siminovitchia sp. 179-K 8D1 HS]|uniref:YtzI protein n=1 Tax=Siminovitchia sp. 179-K 8D1 HS TaxID=3142385 RepID=UPI0039A2DAD1
MKIVMIISIMICIVVILVTALVTSKAYSFKHTIDPAPVDGTKRPQPGDETS